MTVKTLWLYPFEPGMASGEIAAFVTGVRLEDYPWSVPCPECGAKSRMKCRRRRDGALLKGAHNKRGKPGQDAVRRAVGVLAQHLERAEVRPVIYRFRDGRRHVVFRTDGDDVYVHQWPGQRNEDDVVRLRGGRTSVEQATILIKFLAGAFPARYAPVFPPAHPAEVS